QQQIGTLLTCSYPVPQEHPIREPLSLFFPPRIPRCSRHRLFHRRFRGSSSAAFLAENSGDRGGCWPCLGFRRSWRSATGTRPSPAPYPPPTYEGGSFQIDTRLPSTIPFPLVSQQEKKNGESLGVPTLAAVCRFIILVS
ncbi:unnamed protein product, partial [Musa textilis]